MVNKQTAVDIFVVDDIVVFLFLLLLRVLLLMVLMLLWFDGAVDVVGVVDGAVVIDYCAC